MAFWDPAGGPNLCATIRTVRHDNELLERLVDLAEVTNLLLGSIESTLFAIHDDTSALVAHFVPPPTPFATTGVLSIGGPMATTAIFTFTTDASGVTQAAPPKGDGSGISVTFSSDNPAVTLGVASASGDAATAPITGTEAFNLSAVIANVSGAELFDDDGVTPFVQPQTIAVAAAPPPQATTGVLSVS